MRHDHAQVSGDAEGPDLKTVGARIRARRTELGLTLQNVVDRTQLSKSYLSQVEIGKSWPSVGALEQISAVLQTPAWVFVADEDEHEAPQNPLGDEPAEESDAGPDPTVRVVRKDGRKSLTYPGGRAPLQLLTPDLQRPFEVTMAADDSGPWHTVERSGSDREEFALVLEGAYEVGIDDETYTLHAGDSMYFSPRGSYRVRAIGGSPARAIWIATPPAF